MSSCDAHRKLVGARSLGGRSFCVGLAVLAVALPLLTACGDGGFRPMYASTVGGQKLEEKMAQVEIAPIGGKTGQRLRNELIFHTTGGGNPQPYTHRLEIAVSESIGATLVKSTGEAAASNYNLDASFRLVEIKSKKVVFSGSSTAKASFDRFQSIYSNVRAADDAANRAAKTMADELRLRVGVFLSSDKV